MNELRGKIIGEIRYVQEAAQILGLEAIKYKIYGSAALGCTLKTSDLDINLKLDWRKNCSNYYSKK